MTEKEYKKAKKEKIPLYHDPDARTEFAPGLFLPCDPDCEDPDHYTIRPFRYDRIYGWVTT